MKTPFSHVLMAAFVFSGIGALEVPMVIGIMNPPVLNAQSPTKRPSFELASVKPVDREQVRRDHDGHRLDNTTYVDRTSPLSFIVEAYGFSAPCAAKASLEEDCPFVGGTLPGWVKSERFEIQGKLPENSQGYSYDQVKLMLQVLLEDRFQIRVHQENRERTVWGLALGNNKLKLQQVTEPVLRNGPNGTPIAFHGLEGILSVPTPNGVPRTRLVFTASSMKEVAESLATFLDRPVLDQTGLNGEYNFVIEVDQEQNTASDLGGLSAMIGGPFKGLSGPALDLGFQDLGLKLKSVKDQVEILVIDHIEHPSPN